MPRLFLSAILLTWVFGTQAQPIITFSGDRQAVQEVIDLLERDYNLVFSYTGDILENQFITAACRECPLKEALDVLFAKTDLTYKIVGEQYIVLQEKELVVVPTYRLCGRITDRDGNGLPFANIFLPATSGGGSTTEDGTFELRVRGEPEDWVEISYLGYETQRRTVQQLLSCPRVSLSLAAFSFQEVIIKEYIIEGIEQSSDLDHFVLKPDRINVVPGLTEADVLQMTQILPGIQSQDESATQLNIRGGTPDQNLILWDGIPIYNGGHFFGMISSFNPYIVEDVKVYRSGFGPEYGGRVAGVVDIASVKTIPAQVAVNAGINLTHADLALQLPLLKQKAALIVSGRRAYSDLLESPTYKRLSQRVFQPGKIGETQDEQEEGAAIDSDLNFVFNDWNAKWLWSPTDRDEIAVSWFGVKDRLDFLVNESDEDDVFRNFDELNLDSKGLGVSWDRQWEERFSSNLRYASTTLNTKYELAFELLEAGELEDGFMYRQENDIEDRSLNWTNEWQASESIQFDFGYQFKALDVGRSWTNTRDETDADEDRDENAFHALFLDYNSKQEGPWKTHVGVRWTYSTALATDYIEPRLSVQYAPSAKWQLRASAGRYYQFLSQVVELNELGLNQQLWILADDDEEPPVARSHHYAIGAFYQRSRLQVEIEGYYKTITGITSFSPAFLDESLQREELYEEGSGTAWGIDVLLRNRWDKYQTWLSYSYGRVFYNFASFQDDDPFPATHDRPHTLTSVHMWELNRWTLSVSWNWRSGRVYTATSGIVVVEDEEGDEEAFVAYDYDRTNANRLSPYYRLDASILYEFPVRTKGATGQVGLSMLNITDRENILSRQYITRFEEDEAIDDYIVEPIDRAMLRFTPNLVFRIAW